MVGCIYKVIAKVLANWMEGVMDGLVGESQAAFIQGRQILDWALIACETVQWVKKRKRSAVLMKLDFYKAYDFIWWDFVDQVLAKMGFGYTWRSWIHGCITSAKMSILINGSPSKSFCME